VSKQREAAAISIGLSGRSSAFGTVAVVSKVDFPYTSGQELIAAFKATEHVTRYPNSKCGLPTKT
jgi:hypothetical protein